MTENPKASLVRQDQRIDIPPLHTDIVSKLVFDGDLGGLNRGQMLTYVLHRCQALGIDPAERPFSILKLQGKIVLYANKSCTDALCRERGAKREILSTENINGVYVVRARATCGSRSDEDIGAVNIEGLSGDNLANALMKACTKAKRRAALALFGVGALDESEIETMGDGEREDITIDTEVERPEDLKSVFGELLREVAKLRREANPDEKPPGWRAEVKAIRGGKVWPARSEDVTDEDFEFAVVGLRKLITDLDGSALMPDRDDGPPADFDERQPGDDDDPDDHAF